MEFPPHACGLYLTHNAHKDEYATLAAWLQGAEALAWPSVAARQRAIATDELWELQWYPRTPVSSYWIAAPTLEELLAFAAEVAAAEGPVLVEYAGPLTRAQRQEDS